MAGPETGPVVVLAHCWMGSRDTWAPVARRLLAQGCRVVRWDQRGHGRSVAGDKGHSIEGLAGDLATVVTELQLRDAVLVGHSMGGMTLMQFCGDHADVLDQRVAGIALVATAAYGTVPPLMGGAMRWALARGESQVASGRGLPAQQRMPRRAVRLVFGDKPSVRAIDIVTEMTRSMPDAHLVASLQGIVEHDARDALRATRTPSLVVVGTRDTLTPVPLSRKMARLMPGCEFVVLPRAGHQLMQERPNELAELLDALVLRIEGDAASVAEAVSEEDGPVDVAQVEPSAEPA